MSCVVWLRVCSSCFENEEQKDFFSCCIIGMSITFNEEETIVPKNIKEIEKGDVKLNKTLPICWTIDYR